MSLFLLQGRFFQSTLRIVGIATASSAEELSFHPQTCTRLGAEGSGLWALSHAAAVAEASWGGRWGCGASALQILLAAFNARWYLVFLIADEELSVALSYPQVQPAAGAVTEVPLGSVAQPASARQAVSPEHNSQLSVVAPRVPHISASVIAVQSSQELL